MHIYMYNIGTNTCTLKNTHKHTHTHTHTHTIILATTGLTSPLLSDDSSSKMARVLTTTCLASSATGTDSFTLAMPFPPPPLSPAAPVKPFPTAAGAESTGINPQRVWYTSNMCRFRMICV